MVKVKFKNADVGVATPSIHRLFLPSIDKEIQFADGLFETDDETVIKAIKALKNNDYVIQKPRKPKGKK